MTQRKAQKLNRRSQKAYPTRRQFLQFSAAAFSSVVLSNCQRNTLQQSASSSSPSLQTGSSSGPLYLYTWADYFNDELYKRFQDKTGIQVTADVYDSNETMLAKVQAGGGKQYSIIYPSDYMVRQMVDLKLLTQLDQSQVKGLENLMGRWKTPPYDPDNRHSVPYAWGTTGLIYNTELVKGEPEDWNFLWQQKDALKGKITLLDDVREMMGATLKSLGYSYNSTNPTEIEAAYKKLLLLKPSIAAFKTYGWEDQLIGGDLAMCMTYSALGNLVPLENPKLKYVIPKSGTSVWTDTVAIPTSAPNLDAAYAWINFILDPENAVFGVQQMKVPTPNKVAFDSLPGEMKNNQKMFPGTDLLAKCEGIQPVGDTIKTYDKYWTQLKSS